MRVTWLELRDFRCHSQLTFEPEPTVNVLLGENGTGKTSVLEAISYAATLRSFRRSPDAALVRRDGDEAIVRVGVESDFGGARIELSIPLRGTRRVLLNGKRPKTNSELAVAAPVVAFLPDDLDLVKGGPRRRRDFLDALAGKLSPDAGAVQAEYARALRQRNALLRQEGRASDAATLAVWDERAAGAAGGMMVHRLELIDRLEPLLTRAHIEVGGGAVLNASYVTGWADDTSGRDPATFTAALQRLFEKNRGRDMDLRVTTAGPHRDEPSFELDGRPARTEASQGEQRAAALALRLASYWLLEERHGHPPVLLLDDVFSELDAGRSEGVMRMLPRGQVFITSAREDEVPVPGRRWRVLAGSVL